MHAMQVANICSHPRRLTRSRLSSPARPFLATGLLPKQQRVLQPACILALIFSVFQIDSHQAHSDLDQAGLETMQPKPSCLRHVKAN